MALVITILLVTALVSPACALSTPQKNNDQITRRQFAFDVPSSSLSSAAVLSVASSFSRPANAAPVISPPSLVDRFESDILNAPPVTAGTRNTGYDNLFFPEWLEGEWNAVQTLVSTKAPLGLAFIGGPMGSIDVAQATMSEQQKRAGEAVNLQLRFVRTKFGVVEDRTFNLRSRLNSFAGKNVVASVEYADVRESNRASVVAAGGKETDPLTTTLVYFKGPAAQKTFVVSHGEQELSSESWAGYEVDRSIFALTNTNTAPPVTTDSEVLYEFKRIGNDRIEGKLRLAGYLNPQSDKLYFDAKNRAVSLTDYTISLRKANNSSD